MMAIKKRAKIDPEKLEAFAAGADSPGVDVPAERQEESTDAPPAESAPLPAKTGGVSAAEPWPDGLAKTLLIRWGDPVQAQSLAAVAARVDRSQHKTALMALERGLQVLWNESQQN